MLNKELKGKLDEINECLNKEIVSIKENIGTIKINRNEVYNV